MRSLTRHRLLILFAVVLLPVCLAAAPPKTFSKSYKNTRLEVVLNDLCKRFDYELVVDPNDIDMDMRINASFKDAKAGSVLRKVLDKDLVFKIKKGKIYIDRKPLPPEVHTSIAKNPSSVVENDSVKLTIWNDTVYTITCRTITKDASESQSQGKNTKKAKDVPEELPYKGHHLWLGLGAAYADLGYSLTDGNSKAGSSHGSFGGLIQLQYAYFFHENWGLGAGIGFSHYTGYGTLNHTQRYSGQTDTDGEQYTHLAVTHDWKERQVAYLIDVPVEVLFHYPLNTDLGLYAGLGVKAGFIIASDYRLKSGALEHKGEYADWGLTLSEMPDHGFKTEHIGADFSTDKQSLSLKLPAIGVMADLGVTVKLTEQLNLMTGFFFNYTCNNVRPDGTSEIKWMDKTYTGEIASEYVKTVRPWEVGVKIGIDWRYKEKEKSAPVQYTRIQQCDTTVTLQQRVDTVYKPKPAAVREIVRLMETSVIWYDLDSYEPKLQPADILDKIAAILIENPNQRIQINGHASKEGSALHNKRLSENRAKVIYDILLEKGVRAEQMSTRGFGVDKSYQEGEHEISLDRRVEIIPVNE